MKTLDEVKKYIEDEGYESVVILENPDYASAFIGISNDDRAVYDHVLMIKSLMENRGMTKEEAIDYISYNTLRAIEMIENGPIVVFPHQTHEAFE